MRPLAILALGGLAYLYYQENYGSPADGNTAPSGPGYVDDPDGTSTTGVPVFPTTGLDAMDDIGESNVQAFLQTIRASECGANTPDGQRYQTFYGGSLFYNTADHPVITGEKQPVVLPDRFCSNVGLKPGCVSTASGAYQITRPTWLNARLDKNDGYGYLGDFTPASQDIAALRLLRANGALDLLAAGNFTGAVTSASKLWASLAGSTAGQGTNSIPNLLAWFQAAGGALAQAV